MLLVFPRKIKEAYTTLTPDTDAIMKILKGHKETIELFLDSCVHCTFCADSCFLQTNHKKDPTFMPSHKVIHSLGMLYRRKGRVSWEELEQIRDVVWKKCVLCTRCDCLLHLDIPKMISIARDVCRSQGLVPEVEQDLEAIRKSVEAADTAERAAVL